MAEPIVCKALVAFGVDDLREQEVIVSIVLHVYTAVYRSITPSVIYALTNDGAIYTKRDIILLHPTEASITLSIEVRPVGWQRNIRYQHHLVAHVPD